MNLSLHYTCLCVFTCLSAYLSLCLHTVYCQVQLIVFYVAENLHICFTDLYNMYDTKPSVIKPLIQENKKFLHLLDKRKNLRNTNRGWKSCRQVKTYRSVSVLVFSLAMLLTALFLLCFSPCVTSYSFCVYSFNLYAFVKHFVT